jgi:hypothetical protein
VSTAPASNAMRLQRQQQCGPEAAVAKLQRSATSTSGNQDLGRCLACLAEDGLEVEAPADGEEQAAEVEREPFAAEAEPPAAGGGWRVARGRETG